MRYVSYLIDQVRKQTENEDVTEFTGIQNSEFIQYLNDAQHNLQALITQQHPKVFVREKIYTVTSGQDSYDIPMDCYLGNKILNIEFSSTGNERDYYPIAQDTIRNRNSSYGGSPLRYIRLDGKIILNPQPQSSGSLRVTYIHVIDELDLRRAKITKYNSEGQEIEGSITSSKLNTWSIDIKETSLTSLNEHDYICIVDKTGKMIARNLAISSLGSSTITLEAYTPDVNDSTIKTGHYIVGGKNTSTHGSFDSSVERYLLAYCAWKILKRDSSVDSAEAMTELNRMAREIVDSYGLISDDLQLIPQLNDFEDWSY